MSLALLAPTRYLTGAGVIDGLGGVVRGLAASGAQEPAALVVHGGVGLGLVAGRLADSLAGAGVRPRHHQVEGPCSAPAVAAVAAAAGSVPVLVGVGGGRVLDVTKAAADACGAACVLVPTSPATCAAATAVVVDYEASGAYLGSRQVASAPAYAVVEPELLAAAPDRLLAAGLVDALAKVVEVRYSLAGAAAGAAGAAALALCDELERLVFAEGPAALAAPDAAGVRALAAEASVLWPGLIGALAGEGAKLAAAHAVHNALTLLPGLRRSLHGEILSIGILTQLVLEGREQDDLERHAELFARLACPATLAELGAGAYWSDAAARRLVLERACALPSLTRSFPGVGPAELAAALTRADAVAGAFSR